MTLGRTAAPARLILGAGAVLIALGACDSVRDGIGDDGPRVLELTHDTIRLADGVRLVDVEVKRGAAGDFEPAAVAARTGDVVRFTAADHGGHAIVFEATTLPQPARDFLQRTGQMRSPPLITSGAAWVITLDGAPAGEYPFRCTTHDTAGRLSVTAAQ